MVFLQIFLSSAAPLFILIGIGALVDKLFRLDIPTLSKLYFYVFSPVLLFLLIADSTLTMGAVVKIGSFALSQTAILLLIGSLLFSFKPFAEKRPILLLGTVFVNTALYGIPFFQLALDGEGLDAWAVAILMQSFLTYTLGIVLIDMRRAGLRDALGELLKYPPVYTIILSLIVRGFNLSIPELIRAPLDYIMGGYVALSLLMLGARLARSPVAGDGLAVGWLAVVRLILAPIVAAGLLLFFDFEPRIERILFVGAGLPVAVNVFALATEFKRESEFASRIVFWTTLLSGLSLPVLLLFAR